MAGNIPFGVNTDWSNCHHGENTDYDNPQVGSYGHFRGLRLSSWFGQKEDDDDCRRKGEYVGDDIAQIYQTHTHHPNYRDNRYATLVPWPAFVKL